MKEGISAINTRFTGEVMALRKHRRHLVYLTLCMIIYGSGVMVYAVWSAREAGRVTMKAIDDRLLLAAQGLKYMLAPDLQDRAINADSIGREEDLHNVKVTNGFAAASQFTYVYTLVKHNGEFVFTACTVTPEEAKARESWYFYPYADAPSEFSLALQTNITRFATYTDQWGTFRSVALPEVSPGGRRYLACADCEVSHIQGALHREYVKAALTAAGFLLLSLPFMLLYRSFARFHSNDLQSVNQELRAVNQELNTYKLHLEALVEKRTADAVKARLIAEDASRAKSQFVANVSHEIRTPLNAVIGFAEIITTARDVETARQQGEIILRESETLLSLINDLLDHSKMEAGKLVVEHRSFDLQQVLAGIIGTHANQASAKGIRLEMDTEPDVPHYIVGDSLRVRQVLLNLVSNAVKFTPHGSVTIRVERETRHGDQAYLRFSVTDTGIGIAKDKQTSIFESFTQADGSMTRRFGGTGLGTTIARQLVHLMGGEIGVESDIGKGSTFWFTLPLETQHDARVTADCQPETACEVARPHTSRIGHVLLVEDYPPNRELARMHLETAGHIVTTVENGRQATEICVKQAFGLILMDMQMPEMDGCDATRRIRAANGPCARVPIIGMTAHADATSHEACITAGMNDVITKPIRRAGLIETVEKWLAASTDSGLDAERTESSPSTTAPEYRAALDYETLLSEFGRPETVRQMLHHFLDDVHTRLDTVADALEQHNLDTVRAEMHSIRGAAGTLEAGPLAGLASRIEEAATQGGAETLRILLDEFNGELRRLVEFAGSHTALQNDERES